MEIAFTDDGMLVSATHNQLYCAAYMLYTTALQETFKNIFI